MRYYEIFEAAPRLPSKYLVDPETDLAMNPPEQWTTSPYLGAVKASTSDGYWAQIHIPQSIWIEMVDQNPQKWQNAPETFFNSVGNRRMPMRVGIFTDPRQAAWFAQEVLYGDNPREVIEDYFDKKYNGGSGELYRDILRQVPSFDGEALTLADKEGFFADPAGYKKAVKDQEIKARNTEEYQRTMPSKILKALTDFYSKNQKLAQKRLGQKFKSLNDLKKALSDKVSELGIDYFLTTPGGVKLKDVASLPLTA